MAGFVLGTGSGVLASAMVYYTLSTSLHRETADIQHQLHHSSRLLDSSFDPTTPPAPSSLIGPPRNAPVPFSTLLAQRWNHAITSATSTVRQTDFLALGGSVVAATRDLAGSLGNEMKGSASDIQKGKVGRDMGALEGGVGMDRLPGRISPDVSDPTRKDLHEVKEFGEGMREEWGKIKDSLREGPSKNEVKGMAKEMLGDRRLV